MRRPETLELFERARSGDSAGATAFYERCARRLLPLVRLKLGPKLRSELESRDVLQNVLLKAFARLDQVREPGAVMAWLSRLVENEVRTLAEFHGRERRDAGNRVPPEAAQEVPAPLRQALSHLQLLEHSQRLATAMETLSEEQRQLIVLRRLEERSFKELATHFGKSEDACRMAYSRAMAALTLAVGDER